MTSFFGFDGTRLPANRGIPPLERRPGRAYGVWVPPLPTGQVVDFLRFETGGQEIVAVQVLAGHRFPELLEPDDPQLAHADVVPDAALAETAWPCAAA